MGEIPEEAIRMRAYQIWEREGRPHGRDHEHWVRARIELDAEIVPAAPPVAATTPARARSNGGKAPAAKPARPAARAGRAKRPR